jgi:alpha-glucoside transport system substrate-binding protein
VFFPDLTQTPAVADLFRRDVARLTRETGIEVRLTGGGSGPDSVIDHFASAHPSDLGVAGPAEAMSLAREGRLVNLGTFLDVARLRADQSPYLVSLGMTDHDGSWPSTDGPLHGAFIGLNLKSFVWYPLPELQRAGYQIPKTWHELMTLTDKLRAEGRTPWCIGFRGSGRRFDGWPGTDWIEELLLMEAGPAVYDRWTFHKIGFRSRPVRRAFERLGTILFTDGSTLSNPAETYVAEAQLPMVANDPPKCWLYHFPTFAPEFLGSGWFDQTDTFAFPALAAGSAPPVIGGGGMVTAITDRPEVREVVRFLSVLSTAASWPGGGAAITPRIAVSIWTTTSRSTVGTPSGSAPHSPPTRSASMRPTSCRRRSARTCSGTR